MNNPLCPVLAVLRHFNLTKNAPLVGPAFVTQSCAPFQPLTTSAFITSVKKALTAKGYNAAEFAGHSFRRGGASFAYQSGVPLHTIKQLGDWQSDAYCLYVFDNDASSKDHFSKISESVAIACK